MLVPPNEQEGVGGKTEEERSQWELFRQGREVTGRGSLWGRGEGNDGQARNCALVLSRSLVCSWGFCR